MNIKIIKITCSYGAGKISSSPSPDVTDTASGDEDEYEEAGEVANFVIDRAGTPGYASAGGVAQEVRDSTSNSCNESNAGASKLGQ